MNWNLVLQCLGALCPLSLIATVIVGDIFVGGNRRRTIDDE